jgi:hypothetical protein
MLLVPNDDPASSSTSQTVQAELAEHANSYRQAQMSVTNSATIANGTTTASINIPVHSGTATNSAIISTQQMPLADVKSLSTIQRIRHVEDKDKSVNHAIDSAPVWKEPKDQDARKNNDLHI